MAHDTHFLEENRALLSEQPPRGNPPILQHGGIPTTDHGGIGRTEIKGEEEDSGGGMGFVDQLGSSM